MPKKQKTVQVGSKEYHEQLIRHYAGRTTWLMQCRGNLERDDLEYLMVTASKLKDERLKACIAELVGWGDEERAELETLIAIGFEAMKLCSPSRLREAAMRVELKYRLRRIEDEANASSTDGREEPQVPVPAQPEVGRDPVPGHQRCGSQSQPEADS